MSSGLYRNVNMIISHLETSVSDYFYFRPIRGVFLYSGIFRLTLYGVYSMICTHEGPRQHQAPASSRSWASPPAAGARARPLVSGVPPVLRCVRPPPGSLRDPQSTWRRRRTGRGFVQALWNQPTDILQPAREVLPLGNGWLAAGKAWPARPFETHTGGGGVRGAATTERTGPVWRRARDLYRGKVRVLASPQNGRETPPAAPLKKKLLSVCRAMQRHPGTRGRWDAMDLERFTNNCGNPSCPEEWRLCSGTGCGSVFPGAASSGCLMALANTVTWLR